MNDDERKLARKWVRQHLKDKIDIECMDEYIEQTGVFEFTQEELVKPYHMLTAHIISLRGRTGLTHVFTNGCFDILHPGHIALLKFARKQGDFLTVGLNSDKSIRKIKPGRPINNQEYRKAILESICYVDRVVIFDEPTPYNIIKKLKPDILVKGADYKGKKVVGRDIVKKVMLAPLAKGYSTTNEIRKIKKVKK